MNYLFWLPDEVRNDTLSKIKGWPVVCCNATAYLCRVGMSPLWMTLTPMDSEGKTCKTAPQGIMDKFIKHLEQHNYEYEIAEV